MQKNIFFLWQLVKTGKQQALENVSCRCMYVRTEDNLVQWPATQWLRPERQREADRKEGLKEERQGEWLHSDDWGADWATNLLARQLVNTMYEVTVSSIDAVGLLRVVAAPRMTHTWRRGGGGHYEEGS